MADIIFLLEKMDVSKAVREHARAVYLQIARAESEVHGTAIESIHFHEVGSMDAVADVVGVCLLMEMVGAQKILLLFLLRRSYCPNCRQIPVITFIFIIF